MSALHLHAGLVVDGFRIKKLLGEGAMGEIYLAIDEQLGRLVALKFVKGEGLDPASLDRFVSEAKTTARFSHPNIVTVYGAGLHSGRPYLALEYLDGRTLRERMDEGPMPAREVMRLGRAIAEALAEAHTNGVIHADLKPENVVVPRDGRPRVLDFGLARLVGAVTSSASGTPAYMAPERWAAAVPAPPIDVWSLGIMLGEALDGERPLTDRELLSLAYNPLPVALGRVTSASPCGPLVSRCLAPRPADRPSAADVARELEALLEGRATDEARSPFRGLEPFAEADAQDFHGREGDTDLLIERLRTDGLVPIVGPSGVGKSSFIHAGLVPRMKEAGPITVVTCRPGRRPLSSVASALVAQGLSASAEPIVTARSSTGFLVRGLRLLAAQKRAKVLLVIDQFEEVVTLGDPSETRLLLGALAATEAPDDAFRVVIALRSDFLGSFAETALQPSLASLTVLRPLSATALAEAFLAPLRRVGYRPDRLELPARMASELEGQGAALPLLQFAADSLWRRRDVGQRVVLTREYEAMGGATGALATHAERLALDLSETERSYTRALMLQLVNVDGTRRPRTRAELLEYAGGPAAAAALDRLVENRLLVSGQNAETGQPLIELAHESLVSTWPALARWLAETQEARRLSHEIEQAAQLWASRGRAVTETWIGDPLRDALRHVELWKLVLTPLQKEYLAAGVARAKDLERRRAVRLTLSFVGLSLLVVAASVIALVFRNRERTAIEQQAQIRMAAADMGHFEFVLEPFDWDGEEMVATPVNAASLPALSWVLHTTTDKDNVPGPPVAAEYVKRGESKVGDDGALHEVIEAQSHSGWFEFTGRGAGGEGCAPAWLYVKRLPGYADREKGLKIEVKVPTCQASLAGTVEIPAGPFYSFDGITGKHVLVELPSFRIDTYEVTQEGFGVYGTMSALTGDEAVFPVDFVTHNRRRLPMTQIDAPSSERYCMFMGKRLPHLDEWRKAARGGVWLDRDRTIPNPSPKRVTPWGDLNPSRANLAGRGTEFELRPVGRSPDDRSPYGVYDLEGNVTEWSADVSRGRYKGNRYVLGGSWVDPELTESKVWQIDGENAHLPFFRNAGSGVRCSQ